MKKNAKRMMAGLLSGTLALSLAPAAFADEAKPDTWIADRTIVVQAYVDDIGDTLPDNMADTEVSKKIKELTGISLEVQYTPGDNDRAVLASQLAAGNIPDVIISYLNNSTRPEFPILLKAAKDGMFADLTEYLPESKVYKNYLEEGYLPDDAYKNITFREDLDGVYLLQLNIPEIDRSTEYDPTDEYVGGLYIRKDIADDLQIDPTAINTMDDFYDLLVKIKEGGYKDANGNDVYPLGPKYWGGSFDALDFVTTGYNWGVSDFYNIDEEGNVRHEAETDHVFDKLGFVRKLLAEGLMNPEFFTMDATRAKEVSESLNSAVIGDVHNYEAIIYDNENYIPLGPLNNISGDNAEIVSGKGGYGAWAISSEAENPEEIFRFFDWLATPEAQIICEYGIEGVSYELNEDGFPRLTDEAMEALNNGDKDYMINKIGAGFGGSGCYFFDMALTNQNNIDNFGEARPGASAGTTFERSVKLAEDYPVEKKLVKGLSATAYMSADELAMVKVQMDLLDYKETFVQACFADTDEEAEAIILAFREQLKAAGVEQFEDYVKAIYDEDPDAVNFFH